MLGRVLEEGSDFTLPGADKVLSRHPDAKSIKQLNTRGALRKQALS
jgi:hypothetical protein